MARLTKVDSFLQCIALERNQAEPILHPTECGIYARDELCASLKFLPNNLCQCSPAMFFLRY